MPLIPSDGAKLRTLLAELIGVIEAFLRTGLTTASETTRRTFHLTFQEASRLRLLRLGSTLRTANDEMAKLLDNRSDFSPTRFAFFVNRAWMLARGLLKALDANDPAAFDKLLWMPSSQPVPRIEVITLGVVKKVVPATFVMFDFRLRLLEPAAEMPAGQRVSWSCVFPLKVDQEIVPEAFLHLPHKQKFTASQFLENKSIVLENISVARDEAGGGRISLGETSTVQLGTAFSDYDRFLTWDVAAARDRVEKHQSTPFDLDVEMQEEIVIREYLIGPPEPREIEKQIWYPIATPAAQLTGVTSAQADGESLRTYLTELTKKPAPLFGLLHYEKCRLMFQPLTTFGRKGSVHLMLSPDQVDRKTLLKALKF